MVFIFSPLVRVIRLVIFSHNFSSSFFNFFNVYGELKDMTLYVDGSRYWSE